MALFKVLRDCHFRNRYWNEGEIANFPEDEITNEHFCAFNGNVDESKVVMVPDEPMTMHAMNVARKKNEIKTGMAYQPPVATLEKEAPKRGRPKKQP